MPFAALTLGLGHWPAARWPCRSVLALLIAQAGPRACSGKRPGAGAKGEAGRAFGPGMATEGLHGFAERGWRTK
jgi:hypothetical protein